MEIQLLQFAYSTFNEKVRWALDFKQLPYATRNLLPGPHALTLKRLTGNTITPVVRFGETYFDESSRIIAELERRYPEPALLPSDIDERKEVLRIEKWVDDNIGPRTRRCVLHNIIGDARYTARLFGEAHSRLQRAAYATTFPLARALVRKGNGIVDESSLQDGDRAMSEVLDFVAERTAATGYCVGSSFTLADLAIASILAGATNPPSSTMDRPQPRPASLDAWVAQWAEHPGMTWVLNLYERHR